jgi:hypothetical protein
VRTLTKRAHQQFHVAQRAAYVLGHLLALIPGDRGSELRSSRTARCAKPSGATITNPDSCRSRISASVFGYAAQAPPAEAFCRLVQGRLDPGPYAGLHRRRRALLDT